MIRQLYVLIIVVFLLTGCGGGEGDTILINLPPTVDPTRSFTTEAGSKLDPITSKESQGGSGSSTGSGGSGSEPENTDSQNDKVPPEAEESNSGTGGTIDSGKTESGTGGSSSGTGGSPSDSGKTESGTGGSSSGTGGSPSDSGKIESGTGGSSSGTGGTDSGTTPKDSGGIDTGTGGSIGSDAGLVCAKNTKDCNHNLTDGCEVNFLTDPTNCGECGKVCQIAHAKSHCQSGSCGLGACDPDFGNCNGLLSDGCETPLYTMSNCGGCGIKCNPGTEVCQNYMCTQVICLEGVGNCDGISLNGCETNTMTLTNCGGCGIQCKPPANMTASCNGMCQYACQDGFANCNDNLADGCEVNLKTDPTHCGACQNSVCPSTGGTPICSNGTCSIACTSGYDNCDNLITNGCEISLKTDTNNCLGCGIKCALTANVTTASCTASGCGVGSCKEGWGDCNKTPTDGCEISLTNDINNCGACGAKCNLPINSTTATCINSTCGIGQCTTGWADCNQTTTDGCEINILGNDPKNCGGCGVSCGTNGVCSNGTCAIESVIEPTNNQYIVDFDVRNDELVWSSTGSAQEICYMNSYGPWDTVRGVFLKHISTNEITDLKIAKRVFGLSIQDEGVYGINRHGEVIVADRTGLGQVGYVGFTGWSWHLQFDDSQVYWNDRELGHEGTYESMNFNSGYYAPRYNKNWNANRTYFPYPYKNIVTLVVPGKGSRFKATTTFLYDKTPSTRIDNSNSYVVQNVKLAIYYGQACFSNEVITGYGPDVYWAGQKINTSGNFTTFGDYGIWKNNTMITKFGPMISNIWITAMTADDKWVYWSSNHKLWKVSTSGGTPIVVVQGHESYKLWKDGNYLYWSTKTQVLRTPV